MEQDALDPRPLLMKRMMWDLLPHDDDVIREAYRLLGLTPDSDGGMSSEHEASHARLELADALVPALRDLSGFASEIIVGYYLSDEDDEDEDEDACESGCECGGATGHYAEVIFDACFMILCQLLETGVLAYGRKVG